MDKEQDRYLKKCDVCGQVKSCPYGINAYYGTWSLCEDCYKQYRARFNTMSDYMKERIVKEWVLNTLKTKLNVGSVESVTNV